MSNDFEIKGIIDKVVIHRNISTQYLIVWSFNEDIPLGYFTLSEFTTTDHKIFAPDQARPGHRVLVYATCEGENDQFYHLIFSNGVYKCLAKKDVINICDGDKVTVDFDIRMYTSTLKHRGKDIFDIYEELTFMVRLPGTNKVIEILPIGRINKQVITCDGTVIKTHDNGEVDVRFDDLNITLSLDHKFVNKVEE